MIPGLVWGATEAERVQPLPCDDLGFGGVQADRAISIDASPRVVYAWLCQLRVAPYSYDLLDRFGRRSPRRRDPGLTELEVGQRFMSLFDLVSFVPGGQITLVTGRICVTYAVRPEGGGTRLVVRMHCGAPWIVARALALGDLVMMRKQLLTLKTLAEAEQRTLA
ncbi:hypothetical protein [Rhodococcus maanshanensis]|uniref:Polyketide cyclase / dehydrase and lipid transport n=1 Tax=Rhodococcus maanshanensis TaxID=183556 RepID=A0A1H7SLE5_9NOCA|nr:hypothetical protein [Rhodococcus maanshanensis]SEL72926.1 hypothetical protein SAMN05444583_113128 [Rhodococcus maanshanensis]